MFVSAALFLALAPPLQATTEREYVPAGMPLELFTPGDLLRFKAVGGQVLAEFKTSPGPFRLTLPAAWQKRTLYAQPYRNGQAVGAAITLVPMHSPPTANLSLDGKTVVFTPDEEATFSGWRTFVEEDLLLETSFGRMRFRLRPDAAPGTVGHVRGFVKGKLYDGTIWHRVVAKRPDGSPFVIQVGDPAGTGAGGPGWNYPLEKSPLRHDRGVISIARSTDPNTNGCQLFVCLSRKGTQHLDGRYAAFGTMLEGDGVLAKIARVPVGKEDRPLDPPKILRARLVPAYPRG